MEAGTEEVSGCRSPLTSLPVLPQSSSHLQHLPLPLAGLPRLLRCCWAHRPCTLSNSPECPVPTPKSLGLPVPGHAPTPSLCLARSLLLLVSWLNPGCSDPPAASQGPQLLSITPPAVFPPQHPPPSNTLRLVWHCVYHPPTPPQGAAARAGDLTFFLPAKGQAPTESLLSEEEPCPSRAWGSPWLDSWPWALCTHPLAPGPIPAQPSLHCSLAATTTHRTWLVPSHPAVGEAGEKWGVFISWRRKQWGEGVLGNVREVTQ